MSGNWVQRGEAALADKWTRAALALRGGADLILELPTPWAISSAEGFARGAVALLEAAGVAEGLSFGSEAGGLPALKAAADCLQSEEYRHALRRELATGRSFAAARQRAVAALIGEAGAACLGQPNNNLAVEYLRALDGLGSAMTPMTVTRKGAAHDAQEPSGGYRSASALRALLLDDQWAKAEGYLPAGTAELLRQRPFASLGWCQRGVLARLKTMTPQDFARLPDSGEGLSNRLAAAALRARSLEELYALTKTKRYAHSRVRRLALWAFLGLTREDIPVSPPYLRVLGMNERGRKILRRMDKESRVPILTKPAHARRLEGEARRLFELEARCTDLYNLCRKDLSLAVGGMEYTQSPVVL